MRLVGENDHTGAERLRLYESQGLLAALAEEALAAPRTIGWTQRRYSSMRSCSISVRVRSALP
jgi:hypothetical protein